LCRGYFPGWPPADVLAMFFLSLILSFLLGFFLEAAIGMIGFWFLEVSSLLFVYMLFTFFFSGHMFPLDILPAPLDTIVQWIPLQYLAYFPAAVFLGKIEGPDLIQGLWIQLAWVVASIVFCRAMFLLGQRRYSGFGG
jgi:ABC-2 type transport system permease protein